MENNILITRYPIRVADTVFPAGTIVRLASLAEMQKVFPAIDYNDVSQQVGVWFPDMTNPTIVRRDQFSFPKD